MTVFREHLGRGKGTIDSCLDRRSGETWACFSKRCPLSKGEWNGGELQFNLCSGAGTFLETHLRTSS